MIKILLFLLLMGHGTAHALVIDRTPIIIWLDYKEAQLYLSWIEEVGQRAYSNNEIKAMLERKLPHLAKAMFSLLEEDYYVSTGEDINELDPKRKRGRLGLVFEKRE